MIDAVAQGVRLTLRDIKDWLRITDIIAALTTASSVAGGFTLTLATLDLLSPSDYITVNGTDYQIASLNYGTKVVTLTEELVEDIDSGVPVYTHPQNRLLLKIYNAAKADVDTFIGDVYSATDEIPLPIVNHIYKLISFDYENPDARTTRVTVENVGSKSYQEERHADILMYRDIPV